MISIIAGLFWEKCRKQIKLYNTPIHTRYSILNNLYLLILMNSEGFWSTSGQQFFSSMCSRRALGHVWIIYRNTIADINSQSQCHQWYDKKNSFPFIQWNTVLSRNEWTRGIPSTWLNLRNIKLCWKKQVREGYIEYDSFYIISKMRKCKHLFI